MEVTQIDQIETKRLEQYRDARLNLNFHTQEVILDRTPVHLTKLEFALLATLANSAGDIVSRDELMLNVWGYGPEIRTRTMDVHLRRLRVKLGSYSRQHIETVFGLGYRLQPCFEAAPVLAAAAS